MVGDLRSKCCIATMVLAAADDFNRHSTALGNQQGARRAPRDDQCYGDEIMTASSAVHATLPPFVCTSMRLDFSRGIVRSASC